MLFSDVIKLRAVVAIVAVVARCRSKLVAENETGVICHTESYDARCHDGHVIRMTSAKYGRMRMNRCVDRNYGYLGCGSDVTRETDVLCSGRRECSVSIPSAFLESSTLECPRDLKSHLEASHTCVSVVTLKSLSLSSDFCTGKSEASPIQVHLDRGHLSSHVMRTNGLGSAGCPYILETEKGRSFTFVLWQFSMPHKIYEQQQHRDDGSFTHNNNNNHNNKSLNNHKSCLVLAKLKEDRKPQHICSSEERKKAVHVSRSNVVEIIFSNMLPDDLNFLLEFKANKCSHPPGNLPHEIFSFTRSSGDSEQVLVRCILGGGGSWTVRCQEDQWIGALPEVKDCRELAGKWVAGIEGIEDGDIRQMRVTLVAICFIALLFALCILIAGLVIFKCVKRRTLREPVDPSENQLRQHQLPTNPAFNFPQVCCPQKDNQVENFTFYHLPPPYLQDPYKFQENTYSSISEIAAQMPFKSVAASPTLSLRLQIDADKRHQQQQHQHQRQAFNPEFGKLQAPYTSSSSHPPTTFQQQQQQIQQQQQQHHHHHQMDSLCYSPREASKTTSE